MLAAVKAKRISQVQLGTRAGTEKSHNVKNAASSSSSQWNNQQSIT